MTVLTNSMAATDVVSVYSGYMPYRKTLLKNGIRLFELRVDFANKPSFWSISSNASLHAKPVILDNLITFVGSFNFDPCSVFTNTEMGVLFHDQEFSQKM